ncbi:hypothetical protein BH23GEM3_BH23GEM3_23710 [soil metagenome]
MDRKHNDSGHSPISRDHHEVEPSGGDIVGGTVGGASGVAAGAALGSLGGPVGTIIGGIAGAVGGWWTGRSVSEAAAHYTKEDDSYYRGHHSSSSNRSTGMDYDRAKKGYAVGHIAGRNPDYQGRRWEDVEPDLRHGFSGEQANDWDEMRPYMQHAYERSIVIRPSDTGDRVNIQNS